MANSTLELIEQHSIERRKDRSVKKWARRMERDIRLYFLALFRSFVDRVQKEGLHRSFPVEEALLREASAKDEIIRVLKLALDGIADQLDDSIVTVIAAVLTEGGKESSKILDTSFELANPRAVEYLTERSARLIVGLEDTTRQRMRTFLSGAAEEGWSWQRTRREMRQVFDDMGAKRAKLIAVTEVGEAFEEGNYIVGQDLAEAGVDLEKFWLTVGDDRVSEMDRDNTAMGWIPFTDSFSSGHLHPLSHPGCRCTLLTRRKE